MLERISDMRRWLKEVSDKQSESPLHEEPVFRTSDVDTRLTRVNAAFTRVSSLPKPKEKKPMRKPPGNIKIDNITIDGKEGSGNWQDFVSFGDD